jgi:metal-responsive CopG/Arc/MetJ family transcriptional regulator
MNTRVITIELPEKLYAELQLLADAEQTDPIEVIDRLVRMASLHRAWLRDLNALREQIYQAGGLQVGASKDEVVDRLRQTRHELFEAEYAHLYR